MREHKVAYECPACNNIVLGPPQIIARGVEVMGDEVGKSEVDIEYSCRSCKAQLQTVRYDPLNLFHQP
ncbi:MAG: hypothetical protein AABX37_02010 [Nanoarchaeota archaeon]